MAISPSLCLGRAPISSSCHFNSSQPSTSPVFSPVDIKQVEPVAMPICNICDAFTTTATFRTDLIRAKRPFLVVHEERAAFGQYAPESPAILAASIIYPPIAQQKPKAATKHWSRRRDAKLIEAGVQCSQPLQIGARCRIAADDLFQPVVLEGQC